jgi:YVTN family beta-propeller protein
MVGSGKEGPHHALLPEKSQIMYSRAALMRGLIVAGIVSLVFLAGCGGGTPSTVNTPQPPPPPPPGGTNPIPMINALSPSGAAVGGPAFTLAVLGSNFLAGSLVRWNGSDRPTTVVNSSKVTAQISAGDIAAIGTASVTVFNSAPSGGSSNSLNFTIATGGVSPHSVVVDPTGKFAYVANSSSNNVSMYTINATTGALTSVGRIAAELSPTSIAIDPSGKFAYLANDDVLEFMAGNVSVYAINPTTGVLTSIGSPVAADFGAHSVTVDPFGKFVYVANDGDFEVTGGSVSMYTINTTTGALTSIGTMAAPCAPPPSPGSCASYSVALDPSGKFAYVANEGGFAPTSVSMYIINATTGALTSIGTIAAGGRAVSVAVHPSGKYAYVANGSDPPGVSMYTIATTGALTSIGLIAAGGAPAYVAVDPSGKFAYVTNSGSNDVSMYSINTTTGALTSMGTTAAGSGPASIAIDPSGKFAYVTNSGSNDVSMYTIDGATGALTLIGTIGT